MVVQWLKEHCWKWLRPEEHPGTQVAEAIVTEQIRKTLPMEGREWALWHRLGTLSEEVRLTVDFVEAEESLKVESHQTSAGVSQCPPQTLSGDASKNRSSQAGRLHLKTEAGLRGLGGQAQGPRCP